MKNANGLLKSEIASLSGEQQTFYQNLNQMRAEFEGAQREAMEENASMVDAVGELRRDNARLSEERTEKDHLLKELTSKNLDLLARISTLE